MRTKNQLRRIAALALTTALIFEGAGAWAAGGSAEDAASGLKPTNVQIVWGVYVGGISLGKVTFSGNLLGGEYSAYSQLQTGGIVNAFWESRIQADSRGKITNVMIPEIYASDTVSERASQKVGLNYVNGFPAELIANPAYDLKRFPVTEEQKKGTVDPLSGMMLAIAGVTVDTGNPCGTKIPVFDGRRRYDINLSFAKPVTIDEGKHGYRGPALECEMEYDQIAGFKPNLDPDKPALPKIHAWLAPVGRPDAPDKPIYLPLKIWAETDFGVAVANARHIKINGTLPDALPSGELPVPASE
ncbi:MAG: DUF3108 domain-containing protein [Alphaproteobacteria bacterium]|nr:DUF3108 domain-containing protein [Alphaproteobacteria bacterium]